MVFFTYVALYTILLFPLIYVVCIDCVCIRLMIVVRHLRAFDLGHRMPIQWNRYLPFVAHILERA